MKYCKNCQQEVKGQKKFNWIIFILGLLCFGVGGIVYLIYYGLKRKHCPICGKRV
jgi:predicted nucleic acid-binding Zn ribbon protein